MDRRLKKDRRKFNVRILTDVTERRRTLDRRKVDVKELKISDDSFNYIFKTFVSDKKE